jgi:hypothetical protein
MMKPFAAQGALRFDLRGGSASDALGERLMLVPAVAFDGLETAHAVAMGRAIGRAAGRRMVARFGGTEGVRKATLEVVVEHLAGELAITGLGAVHLERWGKALVVVIKRPAVGSDALLGAAIAASLEATTGREVACASLGRHGDESRYFVGSQHATANVEAKIAEGHHVGEVLASLQGMSR